MICWCPKLSGAVRLLLCLLPLFASTVAVAHLSHEHRGHGHHGESGAASLVADEETLETWRDALVRFTARGAEDALAQALRYERQLATAPVADGQVLYLAAWTAQADHRFAVAEARASQLLAAHPGWAPAHLLTAGLALVRGAWDEAREACRGLRAVPWSTVLACQAQAIETPDARSYTRYRALLEPAAEDPTRSHAHRRWLVLTLGDLATRSGRHSAAEGHYRRALEIGAGVRARSALAEQLLAQQRPADALAVIDRHGSTLPLGLTVKRLRALNALGRLHPGDASSLLRRFRQMERNGDYGHGREMAEFYLHVAQDPDGALRVIDQSLQRQREPEDLALRQAALRALTEEPPARKSVGRILL